MRQCTRCIQTEAYPNISFNADGVCSICEAFDRRWGKQGHIDREAEFIKLLECARGKHRKYDAVVGFSGGRDSCYVLHKLAKDYGAHVLAVTHDNGFMHEGARRNIDLMVSRLGVDHLYLKPDPSLYTRCVQGLVKNQCADLCLACSVRVVASVNELLLRQNVPLFVLGFSPKVDPLVPLSLSALHDYRYLIHAVKPHVRRRELSMFSYYSLATMFYLFFVRRIRYVCLPEYIEWDKRKIVDALTKEYGWVDYGAGRSHFDCRVNAAMEYFRYRRTGASMIIEELSMQVRCGQMSRDEALADYAEHGPEREPAEAVETLCQELGITRAELEPYLQGTTRDYRQFKTRSSLLHRISFIFWLTYHLGLTSETPYIKYR